MLNINKLTFRAIENAFKLHSLCGGHIASFYCPKSENWSEKWKNPNIKYILACLLKISILLWGGDGRKSFSVGSSNFSWSDRGDEFPLMLTTGNTTENENRNMMMVQQYCLCECLRLSLSMCVSVSGCRERLYESWQE